MSHKYVVLGVVRSYGFILGKDLIFLSFIDWPQRDKVRNSVQFSLNPNECFICCITYHIFLLALSFFMSLSFLPFHSYSGKGWNINIENKEFYGTCSEIRSDLSFSHSLLEF